VPGLYNERRAVAPHRLFETGYTVMVESSIAVNLGYDLDMVRAFMAISPKPDK
jgi:hypothetical protein